MSSVQIRRRPEDLEGFLFNGQNILEFQAFLKSFKKYENCELKLHENGQGSYTFVEDELGDWLIHQDTWLIVDRRLGEIVERVSEDRLADTYVIASHEASV